MVVVQASHLVVAVVQLTQPVAQFEQRLEAPESSYTVPSIQVVHVVASAQTRHDAIQI
jgi:hypothetical protein